MIQLINQVIDLAVQLTDTHLQWRNLRNLQGNLTYVEKTHAYTSDTNVLTIFFCWSLQALNEVFSTFRDVFSRSNTTSMFLKLFSKKGLFRVNFKTIVTKIVQRESEESHIRFWCRSSRSRSFFWICCVKNCIKFASSCSSSGSVTSVTGADFVVALRNEKITMITIESKRTTCSTIFLNQLT